MYGPKRSLVVDDDHQVVLRLDNKEYKSYMRFFVPPLVFARQYVGNLATERGAVRARTTSIFRMKRVC